MQKSTYPGFCYSTTPHRSTASLGRTPPLQTFLGTLTCFNENWMHVGMLLKAIYFIGKHYVLIFCMKLCNLKFFKLCHKKNLMFLLKNKVVS